MTCEQNESVKIGKKWLQHALIPLVWPTSVTNSAFCWPRLLTVPTAGHVLSAHGLAYVGKGRQQTHA